MKNLKKRFKKKIRRIIKSIPYFLYNLSGIRHIWENIIWPINREAKDRKPSTFIIWIIGLYVALFSIASQRYENRIDLIEVRISSVFTQLSTPHYKRTFSQIAETQKITCPLKPDIKKPITVYQSLFDDTVYFEGVDLLKSAVENWKDSLSTVILTGADLSGAELTGAVITGAGLDDVNFSGTRLLNADLSESKWDHTELNNANFSGAILSGADFSHAEMKNAKLTNAVLILTVLNSATLIDADLTEAKFWATELVHTNFKNSNLTHADLSNANLKHTRFKGANLSGANFGSTRNLKKDQLSESYYIDDPPINLPKGIDPPLQYEEWKELFEKEENK